MPLSKLPHVGTTLCTMILHGALLLMMSLWSSKLSVGQELSPDIVLRVYKSPSAEFELAVDPSQRDGRGKASYELRRHGQSLWQQDLPYTLVDVAVADDGTSGGYGYSGVSAEHPGSFIVALLSPEGRVRREDRRPRQPSRHFHGQPDPYGTGLFLDPPNDRLVIRVSDLQGNDRVDAWWSYTISNGAGPTSSRPREHLTDSANLIRIMDARPIPGLPLTLVQWYSWDRYSSDAMPGTRFHLVDLHGHPVWTLDWPEDFTHRGDEITRHLFLEQIWREGSILATGATGFELRQVQTNQRVRYSIKASADTAAGWQVQEESRSPWAPMPKPAAAPVVQDWTPPHRGTIHLGADSPTVSSPIRSFDQFHLDGHGNFGFIRHDPIQERATVVIVDSSGSLIREIELPRDLATAAQPQLLWINDSRWLLTASYDDDAIRMTWLDVATGTLGPDLDLGLAGSIESIAATGDGGFVLLIDEQRHNMLKNAIYSMDATGKIRWRLEHGSNETAQMITATPDHLIVLDEHPGELRVLDRDGMRLNSVDLAGHLPSTHFSVLGMTWDRQDGVILEGLDGESLQISLDGTLNRRFTPEFPDGRRFRLVGGVQLAPDGSLWTSDGEAFLKLDTRGVVQQILGNAPSTAALGEVALIRVDWTGRIHAMDRRTGAVHRFARDGSRLGACAPPASKVDSDSLSLTLGPHGELHVGLNDEEWIQFDPDCTAFGRLPAADSEPRWLPQPGYPNRWILGTEEVALIAPDGATLGKVERSTDGKWLSTLGAAATAPDGTIAVVSGPSPALDFDPKMDPPMVTLIAADGRAIRSWPARAGRKLWTNIAYDGTHLVFLTRTGTATTRSDYPTAAVITDTHGNVRFRFTLADGRMVTDVFLVDDELWLFDGSRVIDRYAMP